MELGTSDRETILLMLTLFSPCPSQISKPNTIFLFHLGAFNSALSLLFLASSSPSLFRSSVAAAVNASASSADREGGGDAFSGPLCLFQGHYEVTVVSLEALTNDEVRTVYVHGVSLDSYSPTPWLILRILYFSISKRGRESGGNAKNSFSPLCASRLEPSLGDICR